MPCGTPPSADPIRCFTPTRATCWPRSRSPRSNIPAAIAAATAAYRLAWCDGPPFAYDYGLRTARAHLHALGAPEPEMPPYDASKHEPIEEIPIEPSRACESEASGLEFEGCFGSS